MPLTLLEAADRQQNRPIAPPEPILYRGVTRGWSEVCGVTPGVQQPDPVRGQPPPFLEYADSVAAVRHHVGGPSQDDTGHPPKSFAVHHSRPGRPLQVDLLAVD